MDLSWEAAANGEKWMAEVARQSARLMNGADELHDRYAGGSQQGLWGLREGSGSVASVTDLSNDPAVTSFVEAFTETLETARQGQYRKLESVYEARARELGVGPQSLEQTDLEQEYDDVVPRKLYNFYTDEYREASGQ